jgi:thioredoxin-related protein
MKIIVNLVCFFWAMSQSFAQLNLAQFEQIDSLQKVEKRHVIVFIHTDWCKYCKAMHNKTFKNETVTKIINEKFYFVDFDAEEKRKIIFNNTTFHFKPNGANSGIHELAIELATIDKQISYPTLCVLNYKNEIVFQYNGFLNAKDLNAILQKLE